MNFYQFFNQINGGEPYSDPRMPPPSSYDFLDYVAMITNGSQVNGTENGTWELQPLGQEDMARYATDDVVDAYTKTHKENPQCLGKPLDDAQMKKYHGLR